MIFCINIVYDKSASKVESEPLGNFIYKILRKNGIFFYFQYRFFFLQSIFFLWCLLLMAPNGNKCLNHQKLKELEQYLTWIVFADFISSEIDDSVFNSTSAPTSSIMKSVLNWKSMKESQLEMFVVILKRTCLINCH